ncbi:hypothetical protein Tco_0928188 [Tanacetum coccineum]
MSMLRKTTLIKQQIQNFNHMNLSILSVHRYKKLLSLPHAILILQTCTRSYQRHRSNYHWTKNHPLEQVRGNPSNPIQTRRKLATDPEMCMFALIAKYALEILKKHRMDKCDNIGTPMATKPKLDADLSGTPIDQTRYHSMIGSLMYLTSSRPDIVQVVCYCARYQARLTEKHLKEVKMIFRYLKGTINMRLWYPKDSGFELTAFSDADHAEAEYVELSASCAQHSRTKYINVRYHFLKEHVERGIIELYFVRTEYQLADMFTKALSQERFEYLVR